MARAATGQIIEPKNGRAWALRFRAYGERQYLTLGTTEEGWNRKRAETELRHVLADVERGIWEPPQPEPEPEQPREVPTFHEFASEWLATRKPELRPRTVADYEWALSYHLLPFFCGHRLTAITVAEVDRFKAAKLREGKLGAAQINKVLKLLAQIIDVAIEYELIDRANPARGRRRRVKVSKPNRTWVEPEQLMALIDRADSYLRPILATLAGAGLRVGEAIALDWRDVNLATGTLRVGEAKTDAGAYREVDLPGGLIEALTEWKAWRDRTGASEPVFVTRGGRRQTVTNVDHRLKAAIKAANERLDELGIEAISEWITPHSLRRTYASIRAASGDSPIYIAEQLGHEDPGFTFRVYAKASKRRDKLEGNYLEAFDQALNWAGFGQRMGSEPIASPGEVQSPDSAEAVGSHGQAIIRHQGR
jgi:integrase